MADKEPHVARPSFWTFGCRFDQSILLNILKELKKMAGELADLQAAVAASDAGVDSAITLLNGLAAKIDELIANGSNAADLAALSADLKAKTQALADAVVADARP